MGGKHVYLRGGIPGETVSYTLERKKQGFRSGTIETVLQSSPQRVPPFCRHEKDCGGCPWMHIRYDQQLLLKHRILTNALERYGIETPPVPPVIPSPDLTFYRHRMEYAFAAATAGEEDLWGPGLGFHSSEAPGQVTRIHECHMQAPPSRAICDFLMASVDKRHLSLYDHRQKTGWLRSLSIRVSLSGEVLFVAGFNEDRPQERDSLLAELHEAFPQIVSLCHTLHPSPSHSQLQREITAFAGEPWLEETLAGFRFRIHASSFFQPNVSQAARIFSTAREWTATKGHQLVYDLYTGVGTLALFLSDRATAVIGIEGSARAIEDATFNAAWNGVSNATFLTGDILETFNPSFLALHGKPDLIVLDPPRSGTLIEIKKTINQSGANNVIYLSCNPVSLAYDLKQLTEVYRVVHIQPFDMLPQTHHLETLVLLEKE
jgi:23S rRNA (uracil1939-C5)-methyltransferase